MRAILTERTRLGVGLCLAVTLAAVGGPALAQEGSSAPAGNASVLSGGGNPVTSGQIGSIILSEAGNAENDAQIGALTGLSSALTDLIDRGEVALSETAVRELARSAIANLADQELTRDIIESRQFEIPFQQTHSIAGTRNRITFNRRTCRARPTGITITFNRDEVCMFPGDSHTFIDAEVEYDLVFDGYPTDDRRLAKFTIYPAE